MTPGFGALGALYGWVAERRRDRYRNGPALARRLSRPVISVGNLTVGGSGKTPLVVALAAALRDAGERPAILSRGYARRVGAGVTVVSDRDGVRVPVDVSGDEPQLMARRLPGVPVVVGASRHEAGLIAEREHDCTVHLLDDGFQHLQLARDVDLLVVSDADVRGRVLPAGRLREPASAAWNADAWLVSEGSPASVAAALGNPPPGVEGPPVFQFTTRLGAPRAVSPSGEAVALNPGKAVAVSGIARPERFFASARAAGWTIDRECRFRDHHWFTEDDWREIVASARATGAVVVTTEKDAVRLEAIVREADAGVPAVYLPLDVDVPPELLAWLVRRLAERRI